MVRGSLLFVVLVLLIVRSCLSFVVWCLEVRCSVFVVSCSLLFVVRYELLVVC